MVSYDLALWDDFGEPSQGVGAIMAGTAMAVPVFVSIKKKIQKLYLGRRHSRRLVS